MNKYKALVFILLIINSCVWADYHDYFTDKRYRFNYFIEGNCCEAKIIPDKILEESVWGGSKINLIDTFEYGELLFKIFDVESKKLIFSKGYSDLFDEWQTTQETKDSVTRYHECILFPAPKNKIILEIYKRDSILNFSKIFVKEINPKSDEIVKTRLILTDSKQIHGACNFSKSLDFILLSEGYTAEQKEKFYADAERFKNYLFGWEPYKQFKDKINLLAVFVPSKQAGVDIPGKNIWVETIVDAHFYTFNLERYLTLPDLTKVYDYLSEYPIDQVCVLVNSTKYGGGGMYNFCNIFTADNELTERVFLHELGHGFASLGDEYFDSPVAYINFGNNKYEPYEPNITNLVDFKQKWQVLVADTIPVPTPDTPDFDNVVGVFEGANYTAKGFYRSQRNCAMRSKEINKFCKVCEASIKQMLNFYTE
jgi:hypothetical protein